MDGMNNQTRYTLMRASLLWCYKELNYIHFRQDSDEHFRMVENKLEETDNLMRRLESCTSGNDLEEIATEIVIHVAQMEQILKMGGWWE